MQRRMEGEGKVSSENKKKGRFQRICVFCGSRAGYKSAFSDAALELGQLLVINSFFFLLLLFANSSPYIANVFCLLVVLICFIG